MMPVWLTVVGAIVCAFGGGMLTGGSLVMIGFEGVTRRSVINLAVGMVLFAAGFLVSVPAHARTLTLFAGSATQNTLQDSKSAAYGFSYGGRYWHAGYLNLGHPGDGVKTDGVFGGIRDVQVIAGSPVSLSFNAGPYFFASTMPDGGAELRRPGRFPKKYLREA